MADTRTSAAPGVVRTLTPVGPVGVLSFVGVLVTVNVAVAVGVKVAVAAIALQEIAIIKTMNSLFKVPLPLISIPR